jgi:hypothetical protein
MIRTKLGLLGLCAVVLGMMAMSASPAQASLFKWLILNAAKTTSTELLALLVGEKDSPDLTLLTKLLGKRFAITCTNFELKAVHLSPLGTLSEGGKVKFTGCEAYGKGTLEEALGCKVHSAGQPAGTIETAEGKGALLLHETAPGVNELVTKIEPKIGETFATFLTEECVLPESNPVRGKLFIQDCLLEAEIHKVKHLIIQNSLTKLWVGAHTAEHLETSIDGSAWVKLGNSVATGEHEGLEWAGIHNKP